jgi:hypothetical protein
MVTARIQIHSEDEIDKEFFREVLYSLAKKNINSKVNFQNWKCFYK